LTQPLCSTAAGALPCCCPKNPSMACPIQSLLSTKNK
jgi:hypothetical protein